MRANFYSGAQPPIHVMRRLSGLALGTLRSSVAADSALLFTNTLLGAILGVIYWTLAAHVYNISAVGFTSAVVAASTLIALFSNLGWSAVIIRYLPVVGRHSRRLAVLACLMPGVIALAVVSIALMLPLGRALTLGGSFADTLAPLVMSVAMAVAFVQDSIFIARRQTRLVLLRGVGGIVTRFALLLPLAHYGTGGLVAAFVAGALVSMLLGAGAWAQTSPGTSEGALSIREIAPEMAKYGSTNYVSGLFSQAPQMLYPVLIASQVSHAAAGAFAFVWMPASLLLALPASVANVLMSQVVRDGKEAVERIMRVTRLLALVMAGFCFFIFVGVTIFAMFVLPEAAADIRAFLPVMLIGTVPFAVLRLQSMLMAYHAQLWALLVVNGLVAGAAIVLPLLLLPVAGVVGLEVGWLVSQVVGVIAGWVAQRNLSNNRGQERPDA